VDLSGTSHVKHVKYLVNKKVRLAEQKGRYTPNPTREEYSSSIHSLAGAAGSNPAGGVEVCLL